MEFKLGPEIISSYKRLSYKPWYALAEFIDNSTQAYFDNRTRLDPVYNKNNEHLIVKIELNEKGKEKCLEIHDNSIGMSEKELQNAVIVGKPPKNDKGRSKYGIGLKTAACWFGDMWSIKTKKLGAKEAIEVVINVQDIASHKIKLAPKRTPAKKEEHYTIIKIWKLNRSLNSRTRGKIKDYLSSFYRIDISEGYLELWCFDKKLDWNYSDFKKRFIKNRDGSLAEKRFNFNIDGKKVKVWAGVLERGSRADAGFSVIQAERVIRGWPDSYRPSTLFGSQVGGRNDLINQRLVGEIHLEGFDVSHTKDEILFTDSESEKLEEKLAEKLAGLRQLALSYRKLGADERTPTQKEYDAALNEFEEEIGSAEMKDFLRTYEIPSIKLIKKTNLVLKEAVTKKHRPSLDAKLNNLHVKLYLVDDISSNDPYVLIESTKNEKVVIVIINLSHPYWAQLKSQESILNFIRHCAYDGVAEWKTYFKTGKIDPDTVKLIKDNLLRLPFEIEKKE